MMIMNNKILVEVIVPLLNTSYELYIPINKRISSIIKLIENSLRELTNGYYPNKENSIIIDQNSGNVYDIKNNEWFKTHIDIKEGGEGMNIQADTSSLRTLGNQVLENASEYQNEVLKVYESVDNLSASWQGADNQEYVNKVNEYKESIEALGKAIGNYGQFLVDTATNIERVQDEIRSSASRI